VSLTRLDASQFPSHIGVVSASLLNVGNRFWLIYSANGLLLFRVIFNDCVTGKREPMRRSEIELCKSEGKLIKSMKKDIFRDLICNIERLLDEIGG